MIFGLTVIGFVHTVLGLAALAMAALLLLRDNVISWHSPVGKLYVWATILTALLALGIFRHGGFNVAHILALLTLGAVAVGIVAERANLTGWLAALAPLAFSATLLFHAIPGANETLSRVPFGAPYSSGPDDPKMQPVFLGLLIAYLVLAAWQILRARRNSTLHT